MDWLNNKKWLIESLLIMLFFCGCESAKKKSKTILREKSANVQIVAHPAMSGTLDKNIAWCCTFQLTWNVLRDWAGADIRFEKESDLTALLADKERMQTDSIKLDPESYVARCGFFGQGIVKKTLREVKKKFGSKANTQFLRQLQRNSGDYLPDQILAYSHLLKLLQFPKKFELFDYPMGFNAINKDYKSVKSFGIKEFDAKDKTHQELSKQVDIIDYKNDNNFIVRLKTQTDDLVILGKIALEEDLHQAVENVLKRIQENEPEKLKEEETLQIPVIDFHVEKEFNKLCYNPFISESKRVAGYFLSRVFQSIELKMDESGVTVESVSGTVLDFCYQPRRMVFDKPFLIMLQAKNSGYPYFASWINNTSVMKEVEDKRGFRCYENDKGEVIFEIFDDEKNDNDTFEQTKKNHEQTVKSLKE